MILWVMRPRLYTRVEPTFVGSFFLALPGFQGYNDKKYIMR